MRTFWRWFWHDRGWRSPRFWAEALKLARCQRHFPRQPGFCALDLNDWGEGHYCWCWSSLFERMEGM